MKNKMEIREDPKFLMTNFQGILTLNIRRPTPFDTGTYTCRAVNELGEALAECKLEVRGEQRPLTHALYRANRSGPLGGCRVTAAVKATQGVGGGAGVQGAPDRARAVVRGFPKLLKDK